MQNREAENGKGLVVAYNGRQAQLTFSDITQIFPPEEALERFVAELIQAVNVIQDIRSIQQAKHNQATTNELNRILLEITTAMANWYGAIRTYTTERLESLVTSENLASATLETQAQVQFEVLMWGRIREIGHPLVSLCGYWTMITTERGSQEELLSTFDIIAAQLFEVLQQVKIGDRRDER